MNVSGDELAGVVGLFGGLTREELSDACVELRYKQSGEPPKAEAVQDAITEAIEDYRLVTSEEDGYLIPGPAAFPTLPPFAEDLHHILDVEERSIDRDPPAERIVRSLEDELEGEIGADRRAQIEQLSYDLEAWADVDAASLRNRAEDGNETET